MLAALSWNGTQTQAAIWEQCAIIANTLEKITDTVQPVLKHVKCTVYPIKTFCHCHFKKPSLAEYGSYQTLAKHEKAFISHPEWSHIDVH